MTDPDKLAPPKIAVYWDFENIHISLHIEEYGNRPLWERQRALVDVAAVMDFISSRGSVCVNRAYSDWTDLQNYKDVLSSYAIELIQMFPRGKGGKNGTDIQMCVDLVEDLTRRPYVDIFVLVTGDSDFMGALQKVRQYGKSVIGVGVRSSTHNLLPRICDEFKFYDMLIAEETGRVETTEQGLPRGKKLLIAALQRITSQTGGTDIKQAHVKPMMLRLDSTFDERNFGFATFSDFITSCSDIVEVRKGEYDRMINLKGITTTLPEALEKPRKLLVAAMTFLSRNRKEVPMASLKPLMLRLDPAFDETAHGFLTFQTFLRRFPDVIRIEVAGDTSRNLILVCEPNSEGFTAPSTTSNAIKIPSDQVLQAAHSFHWSDLRLKPAPDWQNYCERLGISLTDKGIPVDESILQSMVKILGRIKVLRPKTDGVGITLRDFPDEEAFRVFVVEALAQLPSQ
jgi:hypothetical protein